MKDRHDTENRYRRDQDSRSAFPGVPDSAYLTFWKTIAGPGATAYPADGTSPTVYNARPLRDVSFSDTPGAQSLTFTEITGTEHERRFFNLETAKYIEEGSVVACWENSGKLFTIDKVVGSGVTHRRLRYDTATQEFTEVWSRAFDNEGTRVTGIQGVNGIDFGQIPPVAVQAAFVTAHKSSDGTTIKRYNWETGEEEIGFQHGANLLGCSKNASHGTVLPFGETSITDGKTWRSLWPTDYAENDSGNQVSTVRGFTTNFHSYICGNSSVAKLGVSNPWTVSPTSGDGVAEDVAPGPEAGVSNARAVAAVFSGAVGPNAVLLQEIDGIVVETLTALSGESVYSAERYYDSTIPFFVCGGNRNAALGQSVESYDATTISIKQWGFDTGGTVRRIASVQGFTEKIFVAGDRANDKTLWVLDASGNLVSSFDHGADLRHVAAAPSVDAGIIEILIAGDPSQI